MDPINRARQTGVEWHAGQKYGKHTYSVHLDAVYDVMIRFGVNDESILAAAFLHDTIEDTNCTAGDLLSAGHSADTIVAVDAVSEPKIGTRAERHAVTYPRIAVVPRAVIVKLADRIANVESGGKIDMYRKEHEEFKKHLRHARLPDYWQPIAKAMWTHLDILLNENTSSVDVRSN